MSKKTSLFGSTLLILAVVCTLHAAEAENEASKAQKPCILLLLGPPGSGQGVLAVKIAKALSLPLISSADLLHEVGEEDIEIKQKAREFLNRTGSIPDALISEMLFERVKRKDSHGFLLDGLPRTVEQAEELQRKLSDKFQIVAVSISVPDNVLIDRNSGRLICSNCGRVYHIQDSPPTKPDECDLCKNHLKQRETDTQEIVKTRLENYRKRTNPVLTFFQQKGELTEVNGTGPLEITFEEIRIKLQHSITSS